MSEVTRPNRIKFRARVFCSVILALLICAFFVSLVGCTQPGETMAEGHRRHLRNVRLNQQGLIQDVDTALMIDQPSKLTDKRIR